jgi:hypothetical protein
VDVDSRRECIDCVALCIIVRSYVPYVCSGNLNWFIGKPAFNGKPTERHKYDAQWKAPLARKLTREQLRKLLDLSLPDKLVIQMHTKLLVNKEGCKFAKEFEAMMDVLYTEQRLWGWIKELLNVASTKALDDQYPFIKATHWMHYLQDAQKHKTSVPKLVWDWCNNMVTYRVSLQERADKAGMDLKHYVLHRTTEHTDAGFSPGVCSANRCSMHLVSSMLPIATFSLEVLINLLMSTLVSKQNNDGGLTAEKKWNCPEKKN